MTQRLTLLCTVALLCACSAPAASDTELAVEPSPQLQTDTVARGRGDAAEQMGALPAEPALRVETVAPGLYVIFGPGGNVGVSTGPDGVVVIDDKFARNADEILYRIDEITDADGGSKDLLFVVNTHLHGDHSGSNAQMSAAGGLVLAHDNVRTRMQTRYMNEQFGREQAARPDADLPVVTFTDRTTLHFNGVSAHVQHTAAGHTDGDAIVHFVEPDVIHMGDNLFLGMFPFVDVDAGGSLPGMIDAHDTALAIAGADTVIIPGHGPITDRAGLEDARDALQTILSRVASAKARGDSLQQIINAKPLADMADMDGFIDQDSMITAAWRSLGGAL